MSDFTKEQIHGCFMVTSYMGGNLWPFNGLKHRKTEANEGSIVSPSEGSQGINTPWKTIEARERKHFPFLKYGPSWRVYLIKFPKRLHLKNSRFTIKKCLWKGSQAFRKPFRYLRQLDPHPISSWLVGSRIATHDLVNFSKCWRRNGVGARRGFEAFSPFPHRTKRGEALQLLSCFCSIMVHTEWRNWTLTYCLA